MPLEPLQVFKAHHIGCCYLQLFLFFFPAACLTLGNVPQTDFSIDISFFFLFFFPGDDKKDVKAY